MPEAARMLLNLTMVALLVVAVALGLNNFGAAIAIGVSGVDRRTEIKVATVFGLCDVVMPATGMLIGTGLAGPLGSAARWAGAGILFVTAVWGLIEALRGGDDIPQAWHGWRLLVSGAALSLDDLAVGLALGTVRYPIVLAVTLFGLMSFIMSVIGLKLGGKLGAAAGEHGEVVGAIVLIGISGAMALGWLLPASSAATGTPDGRLTPPLARHKLSGPGRNPRRSRLGPASPSQLVTVTHLGSRSECLLKHLLQLTDRLPVYGTLLTLTETSLSFSEV
jgi:putative Mn2+ efflux pump MntP